MTTPSNLHGEECRQSAVAMLVIDVINDLEFVEGEALLREAMPMAKRIRALRDLADEVSVPVIYANDNFGRWRSDFQAQIKHCFEDQVRGKPLALLLEPAPHHYFVLKPRHSAFFSTTLEILLEHLGVARLIVTGIAGNNCILFTASDAYLREFELLIPSDCIASNSRDDNMSALKLMKQVLKADIRPSSELTAERLRQLSERP